MLPSCSRASRSAVQISLGARIMLPFVYGEYWSMYLCSTNGSGIGSSANNRSTRCGATISHRNRSESQRALLSFSRNSVAPPFVVAVHPVKVCVATLTHTHARRHAARKTDTVSIYTSMRALHENAKRIVDVRSVVTMRRCSERSLASRRRYADAATRALIHALSRRAARAADDSFGCRSAERTGRR